MCRNLSGKLTGVILTVGIALYALFSSTVYAEQIQAYHYDRWNEAVPSQAGYLAKRSVSGTDLGITDFSEPGDLCRDSQNRILIADTKNNRIVITDPDLTKCVNIMQKFQYQNQEITELKSPEGIYCSPETGMIYIADTENSRVLVCDAYCNIQLEITKPDSVLFSQELTFLPQKVLCDKAGNIYVILHNITTGSVMFTPEGEFSGYYGANTVETTPEIAADYFWRLFSTEEMHDRTVRTIPAGITNFDRDQDGFIYTCTQSVSQKKDTVKKLDAAGTNLFAGLDLTWGDYEPVYDTNTNKNYQSMICDIEISEDGNINCLDFASGRIFQYDKDGNLLFILGSSSDQLGGFREVSALESIEKKLLVLDAAKNSITIFEETDFGKIVHQAAALSNQGYYKEALAPWYEVLSCDGNYRRAFQGISSGLLVTGDYENAMKYAKLAADSKGYNKAFECFRREWLTAHASELVMSLVFLFLILKIRNHFHKKQGK